jgi:two-component system, OmpR family, response regulator
LVKKILVVDDDKELCEELRDILKEEGYEVETAFDGRQAQARVDLNGFDLFILDFKMPQLGGLELLKLIKDSHPESNIFIASGRSFLEKTLKESGFSDKVNAIISKPFNIEDLLSKIKSL